MFRILISTDADIERLDEAVGAKSRIPWVAPKDARPGDQCMLSHMGEGITHMGELCSNSTRNEEPPWKGRYTAQLFKIVALDDPVSHEELCEVFPHWKWPTYPRMYTSVDGPLAERFSQLCGDRTASALFDVDEYMATEGAQHIRRHLVRERDPAIVKEKRRQVVAETGSLRCAACAFDFFATYGELGRDFCEVHHLVPMSVRHEETTTRLQDLAVVCSNCHRMLHRDGLLSIEALQKAMRDEA